MFSFTDNNKIGLFLVLAGISAYIFGIILFFDRSLLLLGNVCFLMGLISLVGIFGTVSFFTKKGKLKASMIFFVGFFVLIIKFAIIGGLLQIYGLIGMFQSFFPHIFEWMMSLPGIGPFLSKLKRT